LNESQASVHRAARSQIPAVVAVIDAAYAEFRACAPVAAWAAYLARTRDVAARWDRGEVLVALAGGAVAGTVTFYPDASRAGFPGSWASFGALAVDPGGRGAGIGRRLVLACLDRARARGAPAVGIHSSGPMRAARGLYGSLGFRRCPEFDLAASAVERFDRRGGDVPLLAYRRDI
jgi:predicted N-acetyltransferase YhbS